MKALLPLLWLMGSDLPTAVAQVPLERIRRDSLPGPALVEPIPTSKPPNEFYRLPTDPPNVVRATLDNMPIKAPEPSIEYLIKQAYPYRKPRPLAPSPSPKKDKDGRN